LVGPGGKGRGQPMNLATPGYRVPRATQRAPTQSRRTTLPISVPKRGLNQYRPCLEARSRSGISEIHLKAEWPPIVAPS
jgi:hypothetical protein